MPQTSTHTEPVNATFFEYSAAHSAREAEIGDLSLEKFRWKTAGDIDAVAELFDDDLVFVHLNGRITSKADWISQLRSRRFVYKAIDVEGTPSVKIYHGAAVLVGKARFTVLMNGHEGMYRLVYTEVYARKSTRWKLVNLHTCSY